MKDEVNWRGEVYELEWFDGTGFEELDNVVQVYGFVFDNEGRVCVVDCSKGYWSLPGGGVEDCDNSFEDTLVREVDEEADLVLKNVRRVGYWKVVPKSEGCSRGVHYAVRMVADIEEVLEQTVDPSNGKIAGRKFVLPREFNDYVKWGENGEFQLRRAVEVWEKKRCC